MSRRLLAGAAAVAGAAWLARRAWPGDDLTGQVALVTGGSRGLGYLLARELLRQGCRVAICARDPVPLRRARDRLRRETGGEVLAFSCDVRDADAVERFVDDVIVHFGRLDIVVNNAAIIQVGPVETLTAADFRTAMDTAYFGAVHTTLAALPHMRARGAGRIANITSIGGRIAVPHLLPYDAAKFATVGFSEGLSAELAADGIAVTTVVPGLMRTGSPVHVDYYGQPSHEYIWFALADILPLTAMSAERAARRIVRAIRRREALLTLSWQAKLIRVVHDVAPAATVRVLGVLHRLLPDAGPGRHARGDDLRGSLPDLVEDALERAGARSNQ
jgi:NAD(P)-dependent dehydrogenase (short-subunit alcohol dehydrogenase family)